MTYRRFRDHAGRWHRVQVSAEERRERLIYWGGFYAICAAFGAILTAVSGILG